MPYGKKKLEWWVYRRWKNFDDMFINVDTIQNVTDRQTHTHRERERPHDGIGRAYTYHRAAKPGPRLPCTPGTRMDTMTVPEKMRATMNKLEWTGKEHLPRTCNRLYMGRSNITDRKPWWVAFSNYNHTLVQNRNFSMSLIHTSTRSKPCEFLLSFFFTNIQIAAPLRGIGLNIVLRDLLGILQYVCYLSR